MKLSLICPWEGNVPMGWNSLIEGMLSKLSNFDVEIFQIKEKFGELRVYYNTELDEAEDIINECVMLASTTCAKCSTTESVITRDDRSWICPYCDECDRAWKERYGR